MNPDFYELQSLCRKRQAEAELSRKATAAARLLRILRKKHRTTFIGALARFEDGFGHLWGHGKPEADCNETELLWREVWAGVRQSILDHGHTQLKAVEQELGNHEVEWVRPVAKLFSRPENEEGR